MSMAGSQTAVAIGVRDDGNSSIAQAAKQNQAVEVRLRFDSSFSDVANNLDDYVQGLQRSLAEAAGIEQSRIVVFGIAPGSIIVDFYIFEAAAESSPISAVAAVTLQGKLRPPWFPRTASIVSKAVRHVPEESTTRQYSKTAGIVLQPLSGFAPPSGCACVSGDGISPGCADHRGLGPAWCRLEQPCKSSFLSSSRGHWVFCMAARDGKDWLNALDAPSELSKAPQSYRTCSQLALLTIIIVNMFPIDIEDRT